MSLLPYPNSHRSHGPPKTPEFGGAVGLNMEPDGIAGTADATRSKAAGLTDLGLVDFNPICRK